MQGYTSSSYGDAFADVYDDWYADLDDPVAWRDLLVDLLPEHDRALLELGIGTGRLAIPLAAAGHEVHGIDASEAMLARIPDEHRRGLHLHLGDMVDDLPAGRFGVVFCGFNTFFNLLSSERQQAAMRAVAARLSPGGTFVVDAAVFDENADPPAGAAVELRSMTTDHVVLSVSRANHRDQRAEGQFIDIGAAGVRLRPWAIRWATPDELDHMAANAGLILTERWADVQRTPFTMASTRHISLYRHR